MGWLFLVFAILSEVTATVSLKLSEGFTRPVPSVIVVAGYMLAFYLLSQGLTRGIPLGVAYGIWASLGVALVAVISALFLGESMTWAQVCGIALVIGGVMLLEMGGRD